MPTLLDVARAAGVSTATVSRVLNEPARVQQDTRARVEAAIVRLEYSPSRVARRLRVQAATELIGLLIPDLQNPFYSDIARGVEDVAYENDHALIVCNSDEDPEKETVYLQTMRSEDVDGVILPPSGTGTEGIRQLLAAGIQVVCVDRRPPPGVDLDMVLAANEVGARAATTHLLDLGHTRIGGIVGRSALSTSRERLAGFESVFREQGLRFDESLVQFGDSRIDSGRELALELLKLPNPPSALFTMNNMMTLGALQAIRSLRLRIPQDVALIGFDDLPWATAFEPPISVVSQPSYEMGRRAASLLLARVDDPARVVRTETLECQLVIRGSTGPAA